MGGAKRSAFSLRSFARSHVAFNCVLVEVMERNANVAFETSSLKLDLSMVTWLSSMNGLQELCVYVFQIRVITVTPDDISWILQYPIFPSLTRDQSFTRVARNERKYEKIFDAADFDSHEDCSFIRLNDAFRKTLLKAGAKKKTKTTYESWIQSKTRADFKLTYRKILKIIKSRGLYFSKAVFEGLIFGRADIRRGLSTEGNLRLKIDWASLIVELAPHINTCYLNV